MLEFYDLLLKFILGCLMAILAVTAGTLLFKVLKTLFVTSECIL